MASYTTAEALAGLGGERLRQRVAAHVEQRKLTGGYEKAAAVRGLQVSGEFAASPSLRGEHEQAENERWLAAFRKAQQDDQGCERRRLRLELFRRLC